MFATHSGSMCNEGHDDRSRGCHAACDVQQGSVHAPTCSRRNALFHKKLSSVLNIKIPSRQCDIWWALRVFPGGNQVDGLPPAPSTGTRGYSVSGKIAGNMVRSTLLPVGRGRQITQGPILHFVGRDPL